MSNKCLHPQLSFVLSANQQMLDTLNEYVLACTSKPRCAQVQPYRAASKALDSYDMTWHLAYEDLVINRDIMVYVNVLTAADLFLHITRSTVA